ncbi:MAG: hypothetical protein JXP34_03090 [Planctomycetes bacterium]|nr:hypothetical protein [Planctomycetota bacterium]
MSCVLLLAASLAVAEPASAAPERFIVLSEFQVWADAASPEVFRKLSEMYNQKGSSHVFRLYPHYEYFVWDFERMRMWVDEAVQLEAFNVFCLGDDTRTADGYLFTQTGLSPHYKEFFFKTISYAHEKGFLVAVEPHALPAVRDEEHFVPWIASWLGTEIPGRERADIVKLSLEWFGAYRENPAIADEVEAFFTACHRVNADVLIYLDSIGGIWRQPQPFHRWFLHRFPRTIVSHYLNTDQVDAFRKEGARNMMVQINPSEIADGAGQFFIYHDKTVAFLKDAVRKRVPYISLAGVNFGYNRYNYDLFLEVLRPHLALAPSVAALRASLLDDEIVRPATKEDVRAWLAERKAKRK